MGGDMGSKPLDQPRWVRLGDEDSDDGTIESIDGQPIVVGPKRRSSVQMPTSSMGCWLRRKLLLGHIWWCFVMPIRLMRLFFGPSTVPYLIYCAIRVIPDRRPLGGIRPQPILPTTTTQTTGGTKCCIVDGRLWLSGQSNASCP